MLKYIFTNWWFFLMAAVIIAICLLAYGCDYYKSESESLQSDTTKLRATVRFWEFQADNLTGQLRKSRDSTIMYRLQVADRDGIIADSKAVAYSFQAERDRAVMQSDNDSDRLSRLGQDLSALKRLLVRNKTMQPGDSSTTLASLKTARRDSINTEKIPSLERAVGALTAENGALVKDNQNLTTRALRADGSSVYAQGLLVKMSQKRPVKKWGQSKRKRDALAAKAVEEKRETGQVSPETESKLERYLNQ